MELKELGLIDRTPGLAVVNAAGADTFFQLYEKHGLRWNGGAIEVVDLRTLVPLDTETIAAAVKETNRVIVVTEEIDMTSYGRHVHSWIVQNCFYDLDTTPAFISAIAAPPAPYSEYEERVFYPTSTTIETTIEELLAE